MRKIMDFSVMVSAPGANFKIWLGYFSFNFFVFLTLMIDQQMNFGWREGTVRTWRNL